MEPKHLTAILIAVFLAGCSSTLYKVKTPQGVLYCVGDKGQEKLHTPEKL